MEKLQSEQLRYIESHELRIYLEDAVTLLLQAKEINPHTNVTKHFAEYFQQMSKGTHVLNRPFCFVNATPYNRTCFALQVNKIFVGFSEKEYLKVAEYQSVVHLICPDFPHELLTKSNSWDTTMTPKQFLQLFKDSYAEDNN